MSKQDDNKIVKFYDSEIRSIDEDTFTFKAVISTNAEDRHGEVVHQEGWDIENYKKNPVVLLGHDTDDVIGKALSVNVGQTETTADIQLAVDADPKIQTVYNLIKGGYLKGISVGFINKVREGIELLENELVEISVVSVPANVDSFVLALDNGVINRKDAIWLRDTMKKQIKLIDEKTAESDKELLGAIENLNNNITNLGQEIKNSFEALNEKLADSTQPKKEDVSANSEPKQEDEGAEGEEPFDPENLTDEQAQEVAEAVQQAINEEQGEESDEKESENSD